MDTFFGRVDALRELLGLNDKQFCDRIRLVRSMYANWKAGTQEASRETARIIARRWFVDLDSLYAEEGTLGLEPSPALKKAQEAMVLRFSGGDHVKGTPGQRIVLCYRLMTEGAPGEPALLPSLQIDAWSEYLHWTPAHWELALQNPDSIGPVQIAGAAFFLGWYEGRSAWSEWIKTGNPSELSGARDELIALLADLASRRMLDRIDLRRLIREHSSLTPA